MSECFLVQLHIGVRARSLIMGVRGSAEVVDVSLRWIYCASFAARNRRSRCGRSSLAQWGRYVLGCCVTPPQHIECSRSRTRVTTHMAGVVRPDSTARDYLCTLSGLPSFTFVFTMRYCDSPCVQQVAVVYGTLRFERVAAHCGRLSPSVGCAATFRLSTVT